MGKGGSHTALHRGTELVHVSPAGLRQKHVVVEVANLHSLEVLDFLQVGRTHYRISPSIQYCCHATPPF